ncbi:MAG: undecaprenyl-diphosphate phosphatase [Candidatus Methanomethyliaceae archaeon]|nr:undecaprenyl-diphosphate phosphatase [Candidatus Methanomethyliaceae archaeon]MDW7971035.1 undecaprenyl-diphosphate phosphatase [Nitrososphaerota archaeon]
MDLNHIIFGLIQGATEWLPISSSGHLLIFKHFMKLDFTIEFFIAVHLGTLFSVIIYFRREILEILKSIKDSKSEGFKLLIYILIGNLVTAVIALTFEEYFERLFSEISTLPYAFIASGILILLSWRRKGNYGIDLKRAIVIGAFQGISIIPGISRSGATISSALILGVKAEEAFKFSFLLSIPAIIGANIFKIWNMSSLIIIPMISAFLSGYIAIYIVRKTLKRFHLFSIYCFLIGIIIWILK